MIPKNEWEKFSNSRRIEGQKTCVHLILKYGDDAVVFVHNRRRDNMDDGKPKPAGWGVPTGSVRTGETPVEAIKRELHEETGGLIEQFDLFPKPMNLFIGKNGVTHVMFVGELNPWDTEKQLSTETQIDINDPTRNTDKIFITSPFNVKKEKTFKCTLFEENFYGSHYYIVEKLFNTEIGSLR